MKSRVKSILTVGPYGTAGEKEWLVVDDVTECVR